MSKLKILTLDELSPAGLDRLPRERYDVAAELPGADAVLVRSRDLYGEELPSTLKAVARAGVGVNNIPVSDLTARGVPVFNAPGANANAVKELVLAGLLVAARNLCQAWEFARRAEGDDEALAGVIEAGKKRFRGFELAGRTLGVLGLGAIGVRVANAALELGMRVVGFDPEITVRRAWQLSSRVEQAASVGDVFAQADFLTLHVPLTEGTRAMVSPARLSMMREHATLLNFSRAEIVDEAAVLDALDGGRMHAYVCDFPTNAIRRQPRGVVLPHLGASTREAQENCAIMAADALREFLEHGNIRNSVNFPEVAMPRVGADRLAVVNANVPNMLGQISTALADAGLNILDMINRSRGEVAYTLADVGAPVGGAVIERLAAIDGVLGVRAL